MSQPSASIRLHQALHGYRDGHRLLAASSELDAVSARTMLLMSDLLTTGLSSSADSYLCGYPLKSMHRYVLARTWLATELPRPGCVWTHSVFFDYATLAKLVSLDVLLSFHVRPDGAAVQSYSNPFTVRSGRDSTLPRPNRSYDLGFARQALTGIYETENEQVVLPALLGASNDALAIDIWLQMWPRLRRGLVFCTRVSGQFEAAIGDFQLIFADDRDGQHESVSSVGRGIEVLLGDLTFPASTPLRRFMARYAVDIARPRLAGAVLAEIFDALTVFAKGDSLVSTLLEKNFSEATSAKLLKTELITGNVEEVTRVGWLAEVDARLRAFGRLPSCLDPDSQSSVSDAAAELSDQELADLLVALAQMRTGTVGRDSFAAIVNTIKLPRLVENLDTDTSLRAKVGAVRPEILSEAAYWLDSELDRVVLIADLLEHKVAASAILARRGVAFGELEFCELLEKGDGAAAVAFMSWLVDASRQPRLVVARSPEVIRHVLGSAEQLELSHFRTLAELLLDFDHAAQIDWSLWQPVAERHLLVGGGAENLALATVVFKAGLGAPIPEGARLLSVSFDLLHDVGEADALPSDIRRALESDLPKLGFHRDWDLCARLRAAVLRLYLSTPRLDPSILSLTKSRKTLSLLLDMFREVRHGASVLRQLLPPENPSVYEPWAWQELERAIGKLESNWW